MRSLTTNEVEKLSQNDRLQDNLLRVSELQDELFYEMRRLEETIEAETGGDVEVEFPDDISADLEELLTNNARVQ